MDQIIETTSNLPTTTSKEDLHVDIGSDRAVLANDLRLYIRHAWHVVEPSTLYLENWHIDLIADYLQAVTAGQIKRLLINMPPRYAKLAADSTPVLTANRGWITHGQLVVGDRVFSPNGHPTEVLRISEPDLATMEVETVEGAIIKVNPGHEWTVHDRLLKRWRTIETHEFVAKAATRSDPIKLIHGEPGTRGAHCRFTLPCRAALEYPRVVLPIPPYVLGAWLGDGTTAHGRLTYPIEKRPIANAVAEHYPAGGEDCHKDTGVFTGTFYGLQTALRAAGVLDNKHIPAIYQRASIGQRLELLAGLIDTDGYVKDGRVVFVNTNPRIIDGILELVRSFGWYAGMLWVDPPSEPDPVWNIQGRLPCCYLSFTPDRQLPTKLIGWKQPRGTRLERRVGIRAVRAAAEPEIGHCITVADPDGLYLIGRELVPTHNSTCVSIMWPTWVWAREAALVQPHNPTLEGPGTKWIFASYADELRTKHSLDRRRMLQSEWYRARWPKAAELTGDQNVKTLFTNSSAGQMFATTMTGAGTGLGGNYIVIDDPHKTKEESTSADVKAQVAVYGDTFATRHDDKKQGVTVIVMQRINDLDLSAHVLKTAEEEYVHLKIEAEATEHKVFSFPRSTREFTREPGDLLWEQREGAFEIRRQKAVMGKWKYAAQYQQDPIPEGGAIFQREWFSHRFHRDPDSHLPLGAKLRMVIQSWDTAAKKKEVNDFWACTTWGLVVGEDARIRMLDRTMDRMEYVEGRQKVRDQFAKWKMATAVLVEDSSSGTAIISDLRTAGIPLLPISPAGSDKEANARAVSPMFESGMILLPEGAEWADDYIESMCRFPKGQHDDDVDSTSQGLNYLRRRQHGVMEYIERELAKENEKNLCSNEKCVNGEEGKRKKLGFNMEIIQSGPQRFCSKFCASQYSLSR